MDFWTWICLGYRPTGQPDGYSHLRSELDTLGHGQKPRLPRDPVGYSGGIQNLRLRCESTTHYLRNGSVCTRLVATDTPWLRIPNDRTCRSLAVHEKLYHRSNGSLTVCIVWLCLRGGVHFVPKKMAAHPAYRVRVPHSLRATQFSPNHIRFRPWQPSRSDRSVRTQLSPH